MIEVQRDMPAETLLPVSEVFGPTIQGEGPECGMLTTFLRLGRCNLSCSWCDTPYTWDETRYDVDAECPDMLVPDIHTRLRDLGAKHVTVSGGEPLMQHQRLLALMTNEFTWSVETNGTIHPPAWWHLHVHHTSVSPKLITDDPEHKRIKPTILTSWNHLAQFGKASFKFVIEDPDDLVLVADLAERIGIERQHIWIMPLGIEPDEVIKRHRDLMPHILGYGYNTTTRLHTLIWGNERGH